MYDFADEMAKVIIQKTKREPLWISKNFTKYEDELKDLSVMLKTIYSALLDVKQTTGAHHKDDCKILLYGIWKYHRNIFKKLKEYVCYITPTTLNNGVQDYLCMYMEYLITERTPQEYGVKPSYPNWLKDFDILHSEYHSSASFGYFLIMRV